MNLDIQKPTLLVNEEVCRANISKMATKASGSGVVFRPHFKTHQSAVIGEWYRDEGVTKITVSSVEMAQYFANHGWDDITIAFPYNPREANAINELAQKIKLNLLIESKDALAHLNQNVISELNYFIKIDVGTKRTGVDIDHLDVLPTLISSKNPAHHFVGLLAHAGHAYQILDQEKAQSIYDSSIKILHQAQEIIGTDVFLSYGDTPTCSRLSSFSDVDEIRPGNFVFYDLTQHSYGSCSFDDIGVCMVCPVVAIHPDRNEAVIYGGAVHLSKDYVKSSPPSFGSVVNCLTNGWDSEESASLIRLSQEHGIISGSTEYISSLKIGQLVGVIPAHSCLCADLQPYYLSLSGQKISKLNKF